LSRWRCRNRECEQAIFRERLGEVVAPWARRTSRVEEVLLLVGHRTGGRAAEFLLKRLAMAVSVVFPSLGSSSITVQGGTAGHRQQSGSQEFEAGSTIHLALERLQPIDVAFDRTIAPPFTERVLHRGQIVIQLPYETLHSVNSGAVCFFHPALERGNLPGL
jgi:hypothetical protein